MPYRSRRYPNPSLSVTLFLIVANLLVFLATLLDEELIPILGLKPAVLAERPWTIVTSMFVHANLWHIIANMLTLYFFGTYLSGLIGERSLLIVYFVGGIVGNVFFVLMGPSAATVVGASGAVFALGGVLVVMRPKLRVMVFPIPAPIPLWVAIIGGFLILSLLRGVAWQAHLGGLAVGLVAGYYFARRGARHYRF